MRLIVSGLGETDPSAILSSVGLEATEKATRAAMSEERGAKWYVMSGCKLELSLLSCGEGGESGR